MGSSGVDEAGHSSPLENSESDFCEILSEKEIKQRQGKIIECKGINDDTKRAIRANLESWEEAKSKMSSQQTDASKRKFSGDPDTSASSSRAVKSRKINVHWMAEFPWLRVAGQEQYCEWCSLGTGKMVIVNAAKKKTLLAQHQKSSKHNHFMIFSKSEKTFKVNNDTQTKVKQSLQNPTSKIKRQKCFQLTSILSHITQHGSVHGFENNVRRLMAWLPESDHGLLSKEHSSRHSIWEMVDALDKVLKEKIRELISQSSFIALTIDASTDNSTIDQMDVEMQVWRGGRVLHLFLFMAPMKERTKAHDQAELVFEGLKEFTGLSREDLARKVVSIAADGCSTMQGRKNGVLAKMMKSLPFLLPMSCAAHRANLACEVISKNKSFAEICQLVQDVRNFVCDSPLRMRNLDVSFEEVGLKPKKIERIIDVRWMPVDSSFRSFCYGLPAILRYFRKESAVNVKAGELFRRLSDFTTLWEIFLYLPLLQTLGRMMKKFQQKDIFFQDMQTILEDASRNIKENYLEEKSAFKTFDFEMLFREEDLSRSYMNGNPFTVGKNDMGEWYCYFHTMEDKYVLNFDRYDREVSQILANERSKGQVRAASMLDLLNEDMNVDLELAKLPPKDWEFPNKANEKFMKVLTRAVDLTEKTARDFLLALEARFPSDKILDACKILSPTSYVEEQSSAERTDSLKDVKRKEYLHRIDVLLDLFGKPKDNIEPPIDRHQVNFEMRDFLEIVKVRSEAFMKSCCGEKSGPIKFLNYLLQNGLLESRCPELVKLCQLILTIPFTTVENERRFAHMNLTKTKTRTRLDSKHLNSCLRLKYIPCELWDDSKIYNEVILPAFEAWNSMLRRCAVE